MSRNPEAVAAAIRSANTIAVIAHINPDGDAVGSGLAMAHGLRMLGKTVVNVCEDKVPDNQRLCPGSDEFMTPDEVGDRAFDLVLGVDCSDLGRMGKAAALLKNAAMTAQIDHHRTNPDYLQINDVDGEAPASAVLVAQQLKLLGVKMTREIAICLYVGLATDTGNFSYKGTDGNAFRLMGELMDTGLPMAELNRMLFRQRSRAAVKLLQRALATLEFSTDGRVTTMKLTQRDFDECYALPEHSDAIVNYGLDILGVKMTALLRETPDGNVKGSLRAVTPYDVSAIASSFGGGGHTLAAGCTLKDVSLEEAVRQVRQAMEAAAAAMPEDA